MTFQQTMELPYNGDAFDREQTMTEYQNIYDDPAFFAGYKKMRGETSSLNDTLEQPALWSVIGDSLKGLSVLDLGCGFGDFARKARTLGADAVLGVDVSENMLTEARKRTNDPRIEYRCDSIEDLTLEERGFDLVVSSLMLHYVKDYESALQKIASYLRSGGRLVFSVEHPILTARAEQEWVRGTDGNALYWPVDNYRPEGERQTRWFVEGVVKYHRTIETYVNGLIATGFTLRRLLEPAPVMNPTLAADMDLERRRPPFLLIAATR
jgi:ubiquinone/menaquinone biosynthesis C-methylase UbiE